MTNTPDLTPESVERVANNLECEFFEPEAATLRALSAERDDQKKARLEAVKSWVDAEARAEAAVARRDEALNQLDSERHSVDVLESRVAALKAELAESVETLKEVSQSLDWIAHGCCRGWSQNLMTSADALGKSRAFLARHQKETGA